MLDTIIVKLCNGSNVGHVSNPLACVLAPMLDGGMIEPVAAEHDQDWGG